MKTSNKNYFKGLIIGCGGAILLANGICLLTESVRDIITMVKEQGYNIIDAILHIFGDVFGLALLVMGFFIICEGLRKTGTIRLFQRKHPSVRICLKTKRVR